MRKRKPSGKQLSKKPPAKRRLNKNVLTEIIERIKEIERNPQLTDSQKRNMILELKNSIKKK